MTGRTPDPHTMTYDQLNVLVGSITTSRLGEVFTRLARMEQDVRDVHARIDLVNQLAENEDPDAETEAEVPDIGAGSLEQLQNDLREQKRLKQWYALRYRNERMLRRADAVRYQRRLDEFESRLARLRDVTREAQGLAGAKQP